MAELGVPGASVVLLRDARVCWAAHLGLRERDGAEPVRADTVFEAASMSKPVLACLAMQLVQSGRLALDRPLGEIDDERFEPAQPAQARITARMLLSHCSGLPNWRAGDAEHGPLLLGFEPGARFEYSGEGYYYLQRVLERLTGLSLQDLAERELFRPLGMTHSGFVLTPALDALRARGHDEAGRPLPFSDYRRANAGYTLYTTASDYARFIAALLEARVLALAARATMLEPQLEAGDREPLPRPARARGDKVFWSLGWAVERGAQGLIAYHSGTNSTGFRCFSQFAPARGSGLVLMSNSLAGKQLWLRLLALLGDL